MPYWKSGEISELAATVGIPLRRMSDILHRRVGVSVERALKLQKASAKMKKYIPLLTWLLSRKAKHAAFFGEPRE